MFRQRLCVWVGCLIFSSAVCLAGETSGEWIHGFYTVGSPRPVAKAEAEAWHQASALVESTSTAFVLVGSGSSMNPLYLPGTILVMRKPPYNELKRGQTALYRAKSQNVVAHLLVARVRDGWRVQGLNNPTPDQEAVSPDNFVGVVIAAFQPLASSSQGPLVALHLEKGFDQRPKKDAEITPRLSMQ